jgi:putative redox protein
MEVWVDWVGDMRFQGVTPIGTSVLMDTHPAQGGTDAAPTPMETLLIAAAGCTAMDVVPVLRKMRAPLESLTLRVTASRAADHPKVLTALHLRYVARGPGLQPEQVEKAVRLSQDKYCSISAMLRPTVPITYEVIVEGSAADQASVA